MQSHLHIISFDIPYPANYGGVIDVFHKVRCLHQQGINVILHCFVYGGRKASPELEKLCEKVYYYPRNTSFINQLSLLPFNVKSRMDPLLKANLLKDDHPVLFEVLHTCYLLDDPELKHRKKLFRHSNIEHEYFYELAKAENSFLKKLYLKIEAWKLKRFEKRIRHASQILSVSERDLDYFKATYPSTPSLYLPSFHAFDALQCLPRKGNYILYHGNLSVSENYTAAIWLIEHVFSKVSYPVIIAGLNPPQHLKELAARYPHIELKENCREKEMQLLIEQAHIHCLYTAQGTGLKLKLLNVLYAGRFVIANHEMLTGTSLADACSVCDTPEDFIKSIDTLFDTAFTNELIEKRRSIISVMDNKTKTEKLISYLYPCVTN